jgi:hypothetical protein
LGPGRDIVDPFIARKYNIDRARLPLELDRVTVGTRPFAMFVRLYWPKREALDGAIRDALDPGKTEVTYAESPHHDDVVAPIVRN